MSYIDENRDTYGMYKNSDVGTGTYLMGAGTLIGEDVYNDKNEKLGDIKEFMLSMDRGSVVYAVLSFGGIFGIGEKLFAVPWNVLKLDAVNKRFMLNVDKEKLKNAPGFDKDDWPDMADETWGNGIRNFYGSGTDSDAERVH